jgi:hypothetical protein
MASEQAARERASIEEMARRNPKVDMTRLREAEAAMRELRSRGVTPPTNSVRTPYGQRFVRFSRDHDATDAGA